MRTLLFASLGAATLSIMPVHAQSQTAPRSVSTGPMVSQGGPRMNNRATWGHRVNGRWWGGWQAPGGWNGYRRPVIGFVLPGYWLQPGYRITDYRSYDLPPPQDGFGWSRYYDDAVLTDRYGKVYDSRIGYDWDRHGGYDDGPLRDEGDAGRTLGGAVIGGVTGGLIGSAVADPGDRTGGAILGAGVGAIAGAAIADATNDRPGYAYDAPGYRYDGSYVDPDRAKNERKLAREEQKQRRKLDKLARKAGYPSYAAYARARDDRYRAYAPPTRAVDSHWAMRGGSESSVHAAPGAPRVESRTLPGYVANGYYHPGETITTITIDPGARRN